MRIVNLLFNHKRSSVEKKALGVERCFIDYSKYLLACDNEVLTVFKNGIPYLDEVLEVKSRHLGVNAINNRDVISIFQMAKAFAKFKPDVAICHSGRALSLTRVARFFSFRRFPIVAINHGSNVTKFLKADCVLSVNSFFAKKIADLGLGKERSLVIPNMINIPEGFEKIVKPAFRRPFRIGSLGRISGEKSFAVVLKAMAILRQRNIESEFYLGGTGNEEKNLKNLAKKLNLENNLKLLGWVADKKKFFEEIDIFTLPSNYETFGIVLLEAMLYSTPMVTSNSWGPDDIITNDVNGIKVSKDNIEEMPELLANAIEKLVRDEEFAKTLAVNAHEDFLQKYTTDIVTKKLYQICKKVALK
jgi:glycosyltransferase involved in cell wall biosynthesis